MEKAANESNENEKEFTTDEAKTEIIEETTKKTDTCDQKELSSDRLKVEEIPEENIEKIADAFAYLDRKEFSSEKFKIEIKNLPKYYGINEFRKLLNDKLKLNCSKIKAPFKRSPYSFVCFHSEEERQKAIEVLNNFKWKGKNLIVIKAKPTPDPFVAKRRSEGEANRAKKMIKLDADGQEEMLKKSTTPLWNMPYEEQLQRKQMDIKGIMKKLANELVHQNKSLQTYLDDCKEKYEGMPCELLNIRATEKIDGYRNKCEFSIGINEVTGLPTVGFRIGKYADGTCGIAPIEHLRHIPDSMKIAVKFFEGFVRSSKLKVFNYELEEGHFKQLTARTSCSDQLMLVVGINPQSLSKEELDEFKSDLTRYFFEESGKDAKVTSLYYQELVKKTCKDDQILTEHLGGETHIYETIMGLKFRISPEAFFQINSKGAQVLYESAIELAEPNENSTVIDICCGTGTIGLCFAKRCGQVLGLEVVPQSVLDAKENAKINAIDNCDFFCGKAEDILTSVIYKAKFEEKIAIVDPPRAGLHLQAISQLRRNKNIDKLIYISCNPRSAMHNFITLGRPASKTLLGDPFVPIKAVGVDMFPHTDHCELVIVFERLK